MSFESQCENVISKMGYITSPYAFSLTHRLTFTDTMHTLTACVICCIAWLLLVTTMSIIQRYRS